MTSELTTKDTYPALAGEAAIKDLIRDATGDADLTLTFSDLEIVRFPTGGATKWEIDDESEKAITGVVVATSKGRAYWAKTYEEAPDEDPDCRSVDGVQGDGNPGGKCATCPFNEWGSDLRGGDGKACAETQKLVIARPDEVLPTVVVVPPSSLKAWRAYAIKLASKKTPVWSVVTELTLVEAKNKAGIKYAKLKPRLVERLDEKDQPEKSFRSLMRAVVASAGFERAAAQGEDAVPAAKGEDIPL